MLNDHRCRPETILFSLMSLNGRLSTGTQDMYDVDIDYPMIKGVREGLYQYYKAEKEFFTKDNIDWYFITGRTLAKVGWNNLNPVNLCLDERGVNMAIVDDNHLSAIAGINLCKAFEQVFIVTSNKYHPLLDEVKVGQLKPKVLQVGSLTVEIWNGTESLSGLFVMYVENKADKLPLLFKVLHLYFECTKIILQSGGTLNSELLRLGLVDAVDIVIAPCLIDGKGITNLIDGDINFGVSKKDISNVKALTFESLELLNDSYIRLRYHVS